MNTTMPAQRELRVFARESNRVHETRRLVSAACSRIARLLCAYSDGYCASHQNRNMPIINFGLKMDISAYIRYLHANFARIRIGKMLYV